MHHVAFFDLRFLALFKSAKQSIEKLVMQFVSNNGKNVPNDKVETTPVGSVPATAPLCERPIVPIQMKNRTMKDDPMFQNSENSVTINVGGS